MFTEKLKVDRKVTHLNRLDDAAVKVVRGASCAAARRGNQCSRRGRRGGRRRYRCPSSGKNFPVNGRRETGKGWNAPSPSSPRDSTMRMPSQGSTSRSWSSRTTASAVEPRTSSPEKCTSGLRAPTTDSLNDELALQRTMNAPWFPARRSPFPYHSSHKQLVLPKGLVHMHHLRHVPQQTAENMNQ
jgi:hypothetical protein